MYMRQPQVYLHVQDRSGCCVGSRGAIVRVLPGMSVSAWLWVAVSVWEEVYMHMYMIR